MLLLSVEFRPTFNFLIKWYCMRNWFTPHSIYIYIWIGTCVILRQATSWNRIQHNWDYFIFLMGVDSISWMNCLASYLEKKSEFGYRLAIEYWWIRSTHFFELDIKANKMLYYFFPFAWRSNKEQSIVVNLCRTKILSIEKEVWHRNCKKYFH